MVALCEQVETTIRRVLAVYISDHARRTLVSKRFVRLVHEQVKVHVRKQRNDYLHGNHGNQFKAITEDGLWEVGVSIGSMPDLMLQQFHLPAQGKRAQSGKYNQFVDLTKYGCQQLGEILSELERELA